MNGNPVVEDNEESQGSAWWVVLRRVYTRDLFEDSIRGRGHAFQD